MEFSNETFFHINFEDPFTRVPNTILDNKNLSYQAIGVLTQILRFQNSKEHKVYAKNLIAYRKDGRRRVESALKELENEGFMMKTLIKDKEGKIRGYRYDVFDTSVRTKPNAQNVQMDRENPNVHFVHADNVHAQNVQLKKKIELKENIKKENINIYSPLEQEEKLVNNDDSINTDSVSIPERFGINTDIDSVSIPEPNRYQYRNKDYSINDYSINDIDRYSPLNKQEVQHTMPNVRNEVLNPTACGAVHVRNEVPSNKTNINKTNLTNNIYSSAEQKEEKTKDKEIYKRIVDYLNKTADKSFKSTTKKTISLIDARLKEGFTEEEFYKVIDNKVLNWLYDDKMNAYLRPETLFGNKFESYLNETPKKALKGNEGVKGKTKTNNNKFANFDQTFNKYSEKELDAIIKKSQSVKFK